MKRAGFLLTLVIVLFFSQCETDFEVNADWKDITIVYGLLNKDDTTHYIKINKAFLGEADAYEMAKIRDSSEYKNINATIEQWKSGKKKQAYSLKNTLITNKETGNFYAPEQTVYYFVEPNIDPQSEYKLIIDINNGKKQVSATTQIIDDFTVKKPDSGPPLYSQKIGFANNDNFIDFETKWVTAKDAKRYQISLVFHYTNVTFAGDSFPKTIEWHVATVKSKNVYTNYDMDTKINGESFFTQIAAVVPPLSDDPSLKKRVVGGLDFIFTLAGDDLNTYMEVNEPSTGIVQEKPEYTNIENGIGIFSARYIKKILDRQLSTQTINELVTGEIGGYTGNRGFCNPSRTAPYACN